MDMGLINPSLALCKMNLFFSRHIYRYYLRLKVNGGDSDKKIKYSFTQSLQNTENFYIDQLL